MALRSSPRVMPVTAAVGGVTLKTKAAVLWGAHEDWQIEEVEQDDPIAGEVRVKLTASGLCHSDEHVRMGDIVPMEPGGFPFIGGHEGAGVVEMVGPGVTSLAVGDHVVLGFIPACGRCPSCSAGHSNLCDNGATLITGQMISDGGFRTRVKGKDAGTMCLLGTFSAEVQAGETVVVIGIGGVGINAVQGAAMAGAKRVIAIDPVEFKREQAMAFGATHTFSSMAEALAPITELTWGRGAEKAIITVGRIGGSMIGEMMALIGKNGTAVVTGMGDMMNTEVTLSLFELSMLQKRLQGSIFGGANPRVDIPRLLGLYRDGQLKLDELITQTYKLEDINQGYADMNAGKNIRGVIMYGEEDY